VTELSRIVEDQVGQFAPFDSHHDSLIKNSFRYENTLGTRFHRRRSGLADRGTNTTTQAGLFIAHCPFYLLGSVHPSINADSINGACLCALAAALTFRQVYIHDEVGRDDPRTMIKGLNPPHHVAAASAAITDECNLVLDIVRGLS
jgi:hypothetical protein